MNQKTCNSKYIDNNLEIPKSSPYHLNKCNNKNCDSCVSNKYHNLPNYDNYNLPNYHNYNLPNYNNDNLDYVNYKDNYNRKGCDKNFCEREVDGILMDVEVPTPQPSLVYKSNRKKGYAEVTNLTIKASLNQFCYSDCGSREDGSFYIQARKTNDVITIMWERICLRLGTTGLKELPICATFANLPPYVIITPIFIKINQIDLFGAFKIDPTRKFPFSFIIHTNGCPLEANDGIIIEAGVVNWIAGIYTPCIRNE